MAKKKSNVSINALEKFCKHVWLENVVTMTFPIGEDDAITCEVKKRLSLEETMRFIEDVVSETIMEDDMLIVPMAKEYICGKNILTYYGNFTMPSDTNKAYDLVMGANEIIGAIMNTIDMHQYNMIQGCIHERIEFEKQKMLFGQEAQIRKLTSEIERVTNNMASLFDGVSGEQMSEFITGMAGMAKNTEVTAQDMARAIVEKSTKQ